MRKITVVCLRTRVKDAAKISKGTVQKTNCVGWAVTLEAAGDGIIIGAQT